MPSYAFFHNEMIPLEDAKISVMTHALHYGTALFEGIRGNWNEETGRINIFRLKEHYERLLSGCRLLQIELPYSADNLCKLTVDLVTKSGLKEDVYIRPLAYKSSQALGVRLHNLENDFLAFVIPWGPYLDMDMARCGVSTWRRPDNNSVPPQVKLCGMYLNNALS